MSLYEEVKATGGYIDHHESDLYIENTAENRAILERYPLEKKNATRFKNEVTGKVCLDIPFGYDPAWEVARKADYPALEQDALIRELAGLPKSDDATGGFYERNERAKLVREMRQAEKVTKYEYPDATPRGWESVQGGAALKDKTIDITPRGCKTPEGNARVADAMKAWEETHATVANLATQFIDQYGDAIYMALDVDGAEEFAELKAAMGERAQKQEEFLRAVAGVPNPATEPEAHYRRTEEQGAADRAAARAYTKSILG